LLHAVNPLPNSTKTDAGVEEKEEAAPSEDDGWMEVGKRNRTVITRTVSCFFFDVAFFGGV
jgi:ubiquitin carboxyl-terminal hydrolase 10